MEIFTVPFCISCGKIKFDLLFNKVAGQITKGLFHQLQFYKLAMPTAITPLSIHESTLSQFLCYICFKQEKKQLHSDKAE